MSALTHIVGYADPLVVGARETVAIKVSCHRPSFTSRLVRLGPGLQNADAPPLNHQTVSSIPEATHPGKPQFTRPGSFASVDWTVRPDQCKDAALTVAFWAQPTLPERAGHDQYLFSNLEEDGSAGFASFLDKDGTLTVKVGSEVGRQTASLPMKLVRHRWYRLIFTFDAAASAVHIAANSKASHVGESVQNEEQSHSLSQAFNLSSSQPLTLASHTSRDRVSAVQVDSSSFNGKIDGFTIDVASGGRSTTLLDLDFSKDIPTDYIRDVSSSACSGKLFNSPARAVTGYDWDASKTDWTRASYGYGAIHFHDDDVDDAAWETDFEIPISEQLQSGVYGVVVKDVESEDIVPFFIRPAESSTNKVALIIPTFTYTAYANDRMYDTSRDVHIDIPGSDSVHRSKHIDILEARPDLGVSLYDSHNDGSGTTYSSTKRVVLNMRPDYFHWGFGGPRELPADLWFIGFLDKELGPGNYDVITDHDLSRYGTSLLLRYSVALTCSHPEYPTYSMLDAYDAFLAAGRFFMYLGGNGYYWVTGHDASSDRTHRMEVRRSDQGCRVFNLPPGHWFLGLTGEQGGLWRSRGRTPNRICGLGSDACGMGQGAPYGIAPEARENPKLAFLFKGAGLDDPKNNIIGDFGLVQGAASGDEIDRLDYSLGTPENAIIVATTKLAGGHSDHYALFNEEILFPMVNTLGTTCDKVRSDLVYFDTASGGAVFAVGSINWVGALAWKNYQNNVAQITANALHEFAKRSCQAP